MAKAIPTRRYIRAMADAGILGDTNTIMSVTIKLDHSSVPTIVVEHVADERLFDLIPKLADTNPEVTS